MFPKLFRIEALSSDNRLLFKSSVGEDVDVSLASRFEPELEEASETEPTRMPIRPPILPIRSARFSPRRSRQ